MNFIDKNKRAQQRAERITKSAGGSNLGGNYHQPAKVSLANDTSNAKRSISEIAKNL